MLTILITGANRGLGLEFVSKYLIKGNKVIASYRNSNDIIELLSLKEHNHENLILIELDVSSQESRSKVVAQIKLVVDHIDVLINNAGVTGKRYLKFGELKNEDFVNVFTVNAFSAILLAENLLELLEKSPNQPKIINISTNKGSITSCEHDDDFAYSASKAALNMLSKLLANSLKSKNIIVNPIHPGWVKTRMGSDHAPLTKDISISGMIKLIDSLTLADSGKFFNYLGKELTW